MSYTELYGIPWDNGEMEALGTCKNSFRGVMWIWTKLQEKYLPYVSAVDLMMQGMEPLLNLTYGKTFNDTEFYCIMSTCDGALVPNELMDTVADALEAFEPSTENLQLQADIIRKAKKDGYRYVGWDQTSVNGDAWRITEDGHELRMFNIDLDKEYNYHIMKTRDVLDKEYQDLVRKDHESGGDGKDLSEL